MVSIPLTTKSSIPAPTPDRPGSGLDAAVTILYRAHVLRRLILLVLLSTACQRTDRARSGGGDPTAGEQPPATERERPPPPQRVVTLTPSSTEVVAAVGGLDLLVGVDQFSAYPPEVQKLPKVGDFLHPNVEAILASGCDSPACVVVCDATQNSAKEKLDSFGVRTVTSAMQNISDVRQALAKVGRALGREEAATRAIAAFDAELAAAEARARAALAAAGAKQPRVVLVVDRRPGGFAGMVAAGPDTYLDELLHRAGGENVLADSPVRYTQISAEEILTRAPDVIIDVTHVDDPTAATRDWAALAQVPAVKNGRVHVLADARFLGPGPRLGAALHRLVDLLWPPAPR